jgi:hypothetical protein
MISKHAIFMTLGLMRAGRYRKSYAFFLHVSSAPSETTIKSKTQTIKTMQDAN